MKIKKQTIIQIVILLILILNTSLVFARNIFVRPEMSTFEIQEAITNADSYDYVIFRAGDYALDSSLMIHNKHGITLNAEEGVSLTVQDAKVPVLIIVQSSGISLQNLSFNNEVSNNSIQPDEDSGQNNNSSQENSYIFSAVRIDSADSVRITDCEINGTANLGFYIYRSRHVFISNCSIQNHPQGAFYILSDCMNIGIVENMISDNGALFYRETSVVNLEMYSNNISNNNPVE